MLLLQLSKLVSLFFLLLLSSCNTPPKMDQQKEEKPALTTIDSNDFTQKEAGLSILVSEALRCAYLDKEGILWFGTNNGVYRFNGKIFSKFTIKSGFCNNQVTAITEDEKGDLWFGTADGLCRYDRNTFAHFPIPWSDTSSIWLDKVYPIVNPNEVSSILQAKNGDFWIGTNGAGAYLYDGETFTSYLADIGATYEDGLQHNVIQGITEDQSGNIWFTSMSHGGVSRYDGGTFTHFKPEVGLSDDMSRTSFVDRSGNMWFGYNGNRNSALDKYDGHSIISYGTEVGLCNKNIHAIYEDRVGNLWLGSGREGVCIFDGKTFSEFTTNDGRPFDSIQFIIEDVKGNIWFGGDKLYRYDGDSIISYSE